MVNYFQIKFVFIFFLRRSVLSQQTVVILMKTVDTCQNPLIQARLSLIFPLILVRFVLGLKQIPRKMEITCPSLATFGQRSGQKVVQLLDLDVFVNFTLLFIQYNLILYS